MNKKASTLIRLSTYTLLATAVFLAAIVLIQGAALYVGSLVFVATGSNTLASISAAICCMIPLFVAVIRSLTY